jgi:hypothetical protein
MGATGEKKRDRDTSVKVVFLTEDPRDEEITWR